MYIDLRKVNCLWYENKDGEKWTSPNYKDSPPKGFIYQVSEFPCSLQRNYLKITQRSEVDKCFHYEVKPTFGWIDGVVGRKCIYCYGTQVKNIDEPWPIVWSANGSAIIATGNSTWPKDVVLAMVRPSIKERIMSFLRGYINETYEMDKAILIIANACEKCLNSLCYQYGLNNGYREYSNEWTKAGTVCGFCFDETTNRLNKYGVVVEKND